MENENANRVMYEARRKARGADRAREVTRWQRKVVLWVIAIIVLAGGSIGFYSYSRYTHVTTVRAAICSNIAILSPDTDLRVKEINAAVGDHVKKGQKIVSFDDTDARESLAIAEAARAAAAARLAPVRKGLEVKNIGGSFDLMPPAELQNWRSLADQVSVLQAELDLADATLAKHRTALSRMSLESPVAGTVLRISVQPGQILRKGDSVVSILDDSSSPWIEGLIRERDAALVKPGQSAAVELILRSGNYVDATVEAVGVAGTLLNRSDFDAMSDSSPRAGGELVWVKLKLNDTRQSVLPGMSARAIIRIR